MSSTTTDEATLTHLTRLSQKPGVSGTLILSQSTGAIVRSTGLLSTPSPSSSTPPVPIPQQTPLSPGNNADAIPLSASIGPGSGAANTSTSNGANEKRTAAEEVAALVWGFVQAAGALADGMSAAAGSGGVGGVMGTGGASGAGSTAFEEGEEADELKLLRVRTRRFECVVVPDSKFLLVVVHDTPAA